MTSVMVRRLRSCPKIIIILLLLVIDHDDDDVCEDSVCV